MWSPVSTTPVSTRVASHRPVGDLSAISATLRRAIDRCYPEGMRVVPLSLLVLLSLVVACDPPPAEGEGEGEAPCFDFDERRCSANGAAIERCTGSTNSFLPEQFCPTGEACAVVDGTVDCRPGGAVGGTCDRAGARLCSADGTAVLTCENNGGTLTFGVFESCSGGDVCVEEGGVFVCGTSTVSECEVAGARSCSDDNTVVLECVDNGGVRTLQPLETCTAPEVCGDVAGVITCGVPVTPPERCDNVGERRCSTDGTFVERCSGALNEYVRDETCQQNALCTVEGGVADCRLQIPDENCRPGSRMCSADGEAVLFCEFIGGTTEVWSESGCQITETCVEDAGVPVCVNVFTDPNYCTPGVRRCSIDDVRVEVCEDDGYGFATATSCVGGARCTDVEGVLTCLAPDVPPVQICQPNRRFCDGDAVVQCDPLGFSIETVEACDATEVCTTQAGVLGCFTPPPVVSCTPNRRFCDGTLVRTCNAAGNNATLFDTCTADEVCTVVDGVAGCRPVTPPPTCTPGQRSCLGNLVIACNSDGQTTRIIDTCAGNEICGVNAGVTQCFVPAPVVSCTANQRFCDGTQVLQCNAAGTGTTVADTCSFTEACGVDNGVAQCRSIVSPVICTPGRFSCADNNVVRCNADGRGFTTFDTCVGEETCGTQAGVFQCLAPPPPLVCPAFSRFCDGDDVRLCNSLGTASTLLDTCGADEICDTQAGVTTCFSTIPPPTCVAGTRTCVNNAVLSCNSDGLGFTTIDTCTGGETCSINGCLPPPPAVTCTANRRFCDGDVVKTCNGAGTGATTFDTCSTDEFCAVQDGVAQCLPLNPPEACTPGERVCSNNQVLSCNTNGQGFSLFDACSATEVCGTQAGVTTCIADAPVTTCTANRRFCDGSRVLLCNGTGTGATVAETCTADETCGIEAGVADCLVPAPTGLCTPGERACDGSQILSCQSNGSFAVLESCDAGELCNVVANVPTCVAPPPPQTCTPNTSRCNGTLVISCNASGVESVFDTCGAAETCVQAGSTASCQAESAPQTCTPFERRCEGTLIVECDANGREFVAVSCDAGEVCAVDFGSPRCIPGELTCTAPDQCVCTPDDVATCDSVPAPGTRTGFLFVEKRFETCGSTPTSTTCADGLVCREGPGCTSSVLDETSPFYEFSCPLDQQLEFPTSFDADCRCFINQGTDGPDVCDRPTRVAQTGFRQGSGPSLFGVNGAELNGGIIDGNDILVAAQWGSSSDRHGLILGVDKVTGNRRVISGALPDQNVGSGPDFAFAIDVRKGPDGNLYVLNDVVTARQTEIVRVNKSTGARTLVWRGADPAFGQCPSGDPTAAARGVPVQYTDLGFAIDSAGAFYLGYANAITDGRGIVKISANGATCTTVTANGTRPDGFTRGSGPTLGGFVQGFAIEGTSILAFTTQPKQLLRIDLATGNRTTVVQAASGGIIGERWVIPDTARQLLWTVGFQNSVTIVGVDTRVQTTQPKLLDLFSSCGDPAFPDFPICAGGPININNQNYGGAFLDAPSGRLFFAQDSVSLVEVELSTGNSIIHSL
jgi:hypothetical protein